jgi:outer membrane protein TolC
LAAEQNVRLAKIRLNQMLNRPLDDAFIVRETTLTDSVYLSYLASAREYIDTPRSLEVYTDFLIQEAVRNSPEIQQLDASIAALERSLTSHRLRRFVPSVGLGAEVTHIADRSGAGSSGVSINPLDETWNVSIAVSLPLFEGGGTHASIQQTKISIDQLKAQRAQLEQLVELNLRSAVLEMTVRMVDLESSRRSAEFANRGLELVQDAYSKGGVSIVDLIDAQSAALNGESAALNSVYEFLTGVLDTERALGRFSLLSSRAERDDFRRRGRAFLDGHAE